MPTWFTFWDKSGYEASDAAEQKDKGERALPAHSVESSRSVTTYRALHVIILLCEVRVHGATSATSLFFHNLYFGSILTQSS